MPQASDDRILHLLKSRGAQTAMAVAGHLGVSAVAARKQLAGLLARGLVAFEDSRGTVGRPRRQWSLSERGHARFPDTHGFLTVELLASARKVFGEAGLDRLIAERERETLESYRGALAACRTLAGRVRKLAEMRSREGYMAEWRRDADGAYLLIENHCPICAAAHACQGLCRSEQAIFEAVLGPGVCVTRIDHILAGARRCAYRVQPRRQAGEPARV